MEATEIILWSLKVLCYFLILIGIGGNLALFKEYLGQNQRKRLLFNSLMLWITVFDAFYLIFFAVHEVLENLRVLIVKGDVVVDGKAIEALKRTWSAMFYLYGICYSASVLTTIILAIDRFLVFQKRNTNKCNFKWIFISIGNFSKRYDLPKNFTFVFSAPFSLLSVIGSFLMVLPIILAEKTCPQSLMLTIYFPVLGLLPSLILAILVTALYHGIKDLKTEVNQMDPENIRDNESLKEYKFRAKLLMGIVTVFILSAVVFSTQMVS